jgi:hypothetical protein
MRTVSLTTLRSRVRWRTDTERETSRFPDTELDDSINEAIAQFQSELVRADGQGVEEASTFFMTVNGTDTYALSATLLEVRGVTATNSGITRALRVYSELDVELFANDDLWVNSNSIGAYRIVGANIQLRGMPRSAFRVDIKYVQNAVKLVAPSNTVDGVNGLEEYIVCWAGERFALKNRDWELNGALKAEREEIVDRLRALVSNKNASEPDRFQDGARNTMRSWRWGRRGIP